MREGRGAALAVLLGALALLLAGPSAALALVDDDVPRRVARGVRDLPELPEDLPGVPTPTDPVEDLPEPRPFEAFDDVELPEETRPLAPFFEVAEARLRPVVEQAGLADAPRPFQGPEPPPPMATMSVKEHEAPQAQLFRPGPTPGLAESAAAASALALLGGAVAYFWPLLKYAAAPLYSRIAKDHVLVHGSREAIYRLIKENPGIHAHQVAERLDLAWGTAVHHLKLLEQNGLVVAHRDGRYKRFFVAGEPTLAHKEAVALLRNDTSRRIAEAVAGKPGLIQKDVCAALGISSSLATWHLQRLAEAGLVVAHRRGRVVHYEPGPAWSSLKELGASG